MIPQRDYKDVRARIQALCDGERDVISLMATIAAELYWEFDGFDWVGFYRVTEPELLKIGPYQGGHGCLTIPFERGVCGACARTQTTQLVPDVTAFEGHIACAASTQSELVLPVFGPQGALIAVLDIDSDQPDFFREEDASHLGLLMTEIFSSC